MRHCLSTELSAWLDERNMFNYLRITNSYAINANMSVSNDFEWNSKFKLNKAYMTNQIRCVVLTIEIVYEKHSFHDLHERHQNARNDVNEMSRHICCWIAKRERAFCLHKIHFVFWHSHFVSFWHHSFHGTRKIFWYLLNLATAKACVAHLKFAWDVERERISLVSLVG